MSDGGDPGSLALASFRRLAGERLEPAVRDYVEGGVGDGATAARNEEAWRAAELRPRALAGVGDPDLSVELLGRRRATPFVISPTALNSLVHPAGEPAVARAAATAGAAAYCLSTAAAVDAAGITAAAPAVARWQQLYILRDRGLTGAQVAAAEDAGFEAIVLTVDAPVLALRDHDSASGVSGRTAVGGADAPATPGDFAALLDPDLTWEDLARLVDDSLLPVLVKGIVRGDDAARAIEAGAAGVIVSNHGGRQLERAVPTARALREVVEAVGGAGDVIVDGGLRTGSDVAAALALGARAVGIGRPCLWGLALAGELGARRVLERLRRETEIALTLLGAAEVGAVDGDLVRFTDQTSGR